MVVPPPAVFRRFNPSPRLAGGSSLSPSRRPYRAMDSLTSGTMKALKNGENLDPHRKLALTSRKFVASF